MNILAHIYDKRLDAIYTRVELGPRRPGFAIVIESCFDSNLHPSEPSALLSRGEELLWNTCVAVIRQDL